MRRAPGKNHTYGNINRAKTAEELKAEADAKSNAAYLKVSEKIRNGTYTSKDEEEYVSTLTNIMQEFCDSLIALSKSENPG